MQSPPLTRDGTLSQPAITVFPRVARPKGRLTEKYTFRGLCPEVGARMRRGVTVSLVPATQSNAVKPCSRGETQTARLLAQAGGHLTSTWLLGITGAGRA